MWQLWGMTTLLANDVKILGLYRYPVKGMSGDVLDQVTVERAETFPDDRRYALLYKAKEEKWDESNPEWLHKENFLCAFTAPQLFSQYLTSYQIVSNDKESSHGSPCDTINQEEKESNQRMLTIKEHSTDQIMLGPVDLSTAQGREHVATFFGNKQDGRDVVCVTAASCKSHKHQFGNTSSGVKARGDTRTVHIINAATVRELSETLQVPIFSTRFRPNIVVEGLEPWEEFTWVGKKIACGDTQLSVIKQTVRCEGVSIDPLDPKRVLDIPKLLTQHYPQYGPFFGVYAMIDKGGTMSIGDSVSKI
jgi:uncharacterized protein YcbX